MPEQRLQKCRDAYDTNVAFRLRQIALAEAEVERILPGWQRAVEAYVESWRRPCENAAEQLARTADRLNGREAVEGQTYRIGETLTVKIPRLKAHDDGRS